MVGSGASDGMPHRRTGPGARAKMARTSSTLFDIIDLKGAI
jgi:hypothetical protein